MADETTSISTLPSDFKPDVTPQTPPAPAPEPIEAPSSPEPTAIPEGGENSAPEGSKPPKGKAWWQTRIDEITAARRTAEREAADLKTRLAIYEGGAPAVDPKGAASPANGAAPASPSPTFTKAQFDEAVKTEAGRVAAVQAAQNRQQAFVKAGMAEFPDFNDKCNLVAQLGAEGRQDFLDIVTNPEIMPDGHKVIAELTEHPEEASRILSMQGPQMAAALAMFHAKNGNGPAPKKLSSAPAPIQPVAGNGVPVDDLSDPNMSSDQFYAIRAKQIAAARAQGKKVF